MSHLRWLLVMEDLHNGDDTGLAYRFWLHELHDQLTNPAVSFDTVDELYNALLGRWDRTTYQALPEQPAIPAVDAPADDA